MNEVADHLQSLFSNPPMPDLGTPAQREMARRLIHDGWNVWAELSVSGLGRPGWIDLYATKAGVRVAIEVDRARPKQSSLDKMALWKSDLKICYYLRDLPLQKPTPAGVLCTLLPTRPSSPEEIHFTGYGRAVRLTKDTVK